MTIRDWRGVDPAVVGELYEREGRHWRDALGWDTAWTWATVERGRAARALPGVIAFDEASRPHGWTFYIVERGTLHIGGLVAESAAVTTVLLDAVLSAADEQQAAASACFILDRAAGLGQALAARGFDVELFHYLSLDLTAMPAPNARSREPGGRHGEPWRDEDLDATAALLAASYAADAGVHFAPTGDWHAYVSGLVDQAGCGVFNRRTTRAVHGSSGLEALVAMTTLSPGTAHVAQLAVHPEQRARGLASDLLRRAAQAAAAEGKTTLTLIVGERNAVARRMYAGMGFSPRATFVAARRAGTRTAHYSAAS